MLGVGCRKGDGRWTVGELDRVIKCNELNYTLDHVSVIESKMQPIIGAVCSRASKDNPAGDFSLLAYRVRRERDLKPLLLLFKTQNEHSTTGTLAISGGRNNEASGERNPRMYVRTD